MSSSLSQRMNIADLTFDEIRIFLQILIYFFVCLFQEVDPRLEGPPHRAMNCRMDIQTNGFKPFLAQTLILDGHQLLTILRVPSSSPFQAFLSLLFPSNLSALMEFHLFLLLFLTLQLYSKTQARLPHGRMVPIACVQLEKSISTLLSGVVDYRFCRQFHSR